MIVQPLPKKVKKEEQGEGEWTFIHDYPPEPKKRGTCPKCGSKKMRYTDDDQRCLDCRTWWVWN